VTLGLLCIIWVFASAAVAMMPLRRQYVPGLILLLIAPILVVLVFLQVGWVPGVLTLLAFISMFRNPLRYLVARLRGQDPEIPR
jgi:hypothetical protein